MKDQKVVSQGCFAKGREQKAEVELAPIMGVLAAGLLFLLALAALVSVLIGG